jgi:hypothetical protein
VLVAVGKDVDQHAGSKVAQAELRLLHVEQLAARTRDGSAASLRNMRN